ncbi:MAG: hypothetical protein HQM09_15665 [Candidatus Riflebacteria bacterium]|nr:hypothetical protein [Candidatus Riflebacteria bacterium]
MTNTEHIETVVEKQERERQRVNAWTEAELFLREEKRRELLAIDDLTDYLDFFDDAFEMSRKMSETPRTSGLIQMQEIFSRAVPVGSPGHECPVSGCDECSKAVL